MSDDRPEPDDRPFDPGQIDPGTPAPAERPPIPDDDVPEGTP